MRYIRMGVNLHDYEFITTEMVNGNKATYQFLDPFYDVSTFENYVKGKFLLLKEEG